MNMDRGIPTSIQGIKGKDNKSTSIFSSKKGRYIQSGSEHLRTCYGKSTIARTRRKVETDSVFIQNNATSRKEL